MKAARAWEERLEAGRRRRDRVPRSLHGDWSPSPQRADVLSAFRRANEGRIAPLRDLKARTMAESPFAYFRGSALQMADDLRPVPVVGPVTQICGDAHAGNVGAFAAADGHLTFDLNDFDETARGPWEWDLKRFAASLVLAGRAAGGGERRCGDAVRVLVRSYRRHVRAFGRCPFLELMRYKVRRGHNEVVWATLTKAERESPMRSLERLTTVDARGRRRFDDRPPHLQSVPGRVAAGVLSALATYRRTLPSDRQGTLDVYRPADVAFRVGGVGALGLKNYVVLLFGRSARDPLILQLKQAETSVVLRGQPRAASGHQGRRIALGQRIMQTGSDPLVGWTSIGSDQFVVRQLSDHKAGLNARDLSGRFLLELGDVAGEILAKAHARRADAGVIAGYCGASDRFDEALVRFAALYADQTEKDRAAFKRATRRGRR